MMRNRTTIAPISPSWYRLVGHRHGAKRQALARGEFFCRAFKLAAGGENVAAARRPHRRGIASIENNLGEFFDLFPVGAFIGAAGPGIERDQIDLRRNAFEE